MVKAVTSQAYRLPFKELQMDCEERPVMNLGHSRRWHCPRITFE